MAQVDDLSRSLSAFDQNATLVVVVEMSESSWLVAGMLPGVDRQPVKKLEPDPDGLHRLLERWRVEATKAGQKISPGENGIAFSSKPGFARKRAWNSIF
jgi:transposase